MVGAGAAIAVAALIAQATVGQPSSPYEVGAITFALHADDPLGTRRMGAFCLPAGTIRWRDAKPNREDAREIVAQAMTAAATPAAVTTGAVAASAYRVTGDVTHLLLDACVPSTGIGSILNRSRTTKGMGLIKVRWVVTGADAAVAPVTMKRCSRFTFRDSGRTLGDITLLGLERAAADLAAQLAHPGGARSAAAGTECDAD